MKHGLAMLYRRPHVLLQGNLANDKTYSWRDL